MATIRRAIRGLLRVQWSDDGREVQVRSGDFWENGRDGTILFAQLDAGRLKEIRRVRYPPSE